MVRRLLRRPILFGPRTDLPAGVQQLADWSQGSAPNLPIDTVEIKSGTSIYDISGNTFIASLMVDPGATLEITKGALIAGSLVDNGTIIVEGDPPALVINGPATIGSTGLIAATGTGDTVDLNGNTFNFGKVTASQGGTVLVDGAVVNEPGSTRATAGHITATGTGSEIDFVTNVFNFGTIAARQGALVKFEGGTVTNEPGGEGQVAGQILARGRGSEVELTVATLINLGVVVATHHGTMFIDAATVINGSATDTTALIEAGHHGNITITEASGSKNFGIILATDGGTLTVNHSGGSTNEVTGWIKSEGCGSTLTLNDNESQVNYGAIIADNRGTLIVNVADNFGNGDPKNVPGGNFGVMKAVSGGRLEIVGDIINYFGATIEARGEHSTTEFIGADYEDGSPTLIDNQGRILATDCGLVSFCDVGVENDLVMRATLGGRMSFDYTYLVNTLGAKITAADDGAIKIANSYLTNDGEIESKKRGAIWIDHTSAKNTGTIESVGLCSAVILSCDLIGNTGTVFAKDAGAVEVFDSKFLNAGSGEVESKGYDSIATFRHDSIANRHGAEITATDFGTILFDDDKIINKHNSTISASLGGLIKIDYSEIVNKDHSVIKAGDGGGITLADDCITNTGASTIEAKGYYSTVNLEHTFVMNDGGMIAAIGCDAVVNLFDTKIVGGTLKTGHGGVIETAAGTEGSHTTSTFDDVTNTGYVLVQSNTTLVLEGTIHNDGTIFVDPESGPGADLQIDDKVFLDGSGIVELDGRDDKILGGRDGGTLINHSTIAGFGQIGAGDDDLSLHNKVNGTIDADVAGERLVVDTGCNVIANAGHLESTRGILEIRSDVANACGVIGAYGSSALVKLFGVTITGGKIETGDPYWRDNGVIEVAAAGWPAITIFDGAQHHDPVTIAGFVQVDPNADLELKGHIDLAGGAIELDQLGRDGADLIISGHVTLTGYGDVALEGNNTAIVGVDCQVSTLDNEASIIGARGGSIGDGGDSLIFINCGTVDSEAGHAGPLVIDTGYHAVVNTGTLEATGLSELDLYGTYDNRGGTIGAYSDGVGPSVVKLFDAKIEGGTVATDGGSTIEIVAMKGDDDDPNMSVFDGSRDHAVTNDGYVLVDAGANLELIGTIHNHGTIEVDGKQTDLVIDGSVTLDGQGTIVLDNANHPADQIVGGNEDSNTLYNVNNTIEGAGNIGTADRDLWLVNESCGTIEANDDGQKLTIDTGHNQITNAGTFEATNGGILDVGIHGDGGSVNNARGELFVGIGSMIDIADAITGGKAIIQGGTLKFDATSSVGVTFDNGSGTPTYGELIFGNSASALDYSGKIDDFGGTSSAASDKIELVSIDPGDVTYKTHGSNTVITITVGDQTNKITLDGFTGSLDIASDGHDGTLITDPPTSPSDNGAGSATLTIESGTLMENAKISAGIPVAEAVTNVDGSISEFMLGNDQINLGSSQTATDTHSNVSVPNPGHPGTTVNTMSVSIGGPGNDNFVFQPGIGADTIVNFNPQHDTIELDHFANIQNVQELAAAITPDVHGNAVLELGHGDSIAIPGVNTTFLQQNIQSLVHLHA